MTRFLFFFSWLLGPRVASRFILFYVLAMLFLFYCVIGGWPQVPAAPAHAIQLSLIHIDVYKRQV